MRVGREAEGEMERISSRHPPKHGAACRAHPTTLRSCTEPKPRVRCFSD